MDKHHHGFTIIEVVIVIVVIGVLAGIATASYRGAQRRSAEIAVQHDLKNAAQAIISARNFSNPMPTSFSASPNVSLTLSPTRSHYSGLSPVQNGILLAQICSDLIAENLGKGINQAGDTDAYVTGCGNWNHNSMQVTGWTSKVFPTPVTANQLLTYAASVPSGDSWHPNQQSVVKNFYLALHSRLLAQGGSFPVTSFWDSWATPTNGGVSSQPLPAPDQQLSPDYCVNASHGRYADLLWHITQGSEPTTGSC